MVWVLLLLGQSVLLPAAGCTQDSFRCGVRVEGKTDEVTRCSRNLEVCVCETNLCARQVAVTAECQSGLQYVEEPFVTASLAGKCVTGLLRPDWLVRSDSVSTVLPLCSVEVMTDAGVDQGVQDGASANDGEMSIDPGDLSGADASRGG